MSRPVKLVSHDNLPSWAIDNEYIVHGYRAPGGINEETSASVDTKSKTSSVKASSKKRAAKSNGAVSDVTFSETFYEHNTIYRCWLSVWLYLHNETVNIHTHLWGALIAIAVTFLHILALYDLIPTVLYPITHHSIFYPQAIIPIPKIHASSSWLSVFSKDILKAPLPKEIASFLSLPLNRLTPWLIAQQRPNDWKDVIGFASYLLGAITVLSFSATFHTLACHSKKAHQDYNKLDYIGIVAMIVGSFIPMLHYGFYCHPHLQFFYSTSILSLGGFAMYTVLARKYATPAYRPIRTSVFLALGLSAIFPVAHICALYGYKTVSTTMGVDWIIAGGALYIIGACLYMARIPERFSPGTFDYFGASHQIFHILINLAAFSHYVCIRRAYTFWHAAETINGEAICKALEALR